MYFEFTRNASPKVYREYDRATSIIGYYKKAVL